MNETNATNSGGFINQSSTSTNLMDDLVKEYLLFRGFNTCLKSFDNDLKVDKDKSLKADKIVEQLFQYINSFDLNGLLDYWSYLDLKYFSRLTLKIPGSLSLTRKYELFLLRYYLINAIQSNKNDKAVEFFETYTQKLQSQLEWKEWFCLPFLKNPEENPTFAVYFSKNWIDSFYISMQNFLSIVFQSIQYPRLLNYDEESFWLKQQQQQQQQQNYSLNKDDYLTDEFNLLETNNQNKQSSSLISIFKNFKTSSISSTSTSNSTNTKQTTSTRSRLFSKKSNAESTNNNNNNINNTTKTNLKLNEDSNNAKQKVEELTNASLVAIETDSTNKHKQTQSQESKLISNEIKLEPTTKIETPYLILSEEEFKEHKSSVVNCKVSRDGKYVVSIDTQGIAKIWSLDDKQNILMVKGTYTSVEWDKKSNKLIYLATYKQPLIKLYDLTQKKITQEIELSKHQVNMIYMSSMNLNNKLICVLNDYQQQDHLIICSQVNSILKIDKQLSLDTTNQVKCLTCSGNNLLVGLVNGSLKAYDVEINKLNYSITAHKKDLISIQVNKDQTKLFTESLDNTLKIWSLNNNQRIDLIKSLDLNNLVGLTDYLTNLNDMFNLVLTQKSLFTVDSSDNIYLLTQSNVNFIEVLNEKTSQFKTINTSNSANVYCTSIEIWSASHSSILFVAQNDGLIRIFKILSHI